MATVTFSELATQSGTDRTIYAAWTFSSSYSSYVDEYDYKWYYSISGSKQWFEGSTGSSNVKNCTYSAPSNAKKVKVKVKPISKTHTVNGSDTTYFTGEWNTSDKFVVGSDVPTAESIDGVTNLTVGMQGNTSGTVAASWSWSQSHTDSYTVKWEYAVGDGDTNMYVGEETSVTTKNATWSLPENAVRIRVSVTPVSETYSWGSTEISYWTAATVKSDKIEVSGGTGSGALIVNYEDAVTITEMGVQSNTSGATNYVKWTCSLKNVDHYEVQWYYTTGEQHKFDGGSNSVTMTIATYDPPDNAVQVLCSIQPICATSDWTADPVMSDAYVAVGAIPDQLSAPDVSFGDSEDEETNQYQMTAKVTNINDSTDSTDYVEFQFYSDDSLISTVYAKVVTDRATGYCYVSAGGKYRARCRGINALSVDRAGEGSDLTVTLTTGSVVTITYPTYGEWSDYSDEISPGPDTPTDPACSAYDETVVKVTWTKANAATGYVIQYATDKEYLSTSTGDSTTYTVETDVDTAYITGLTSGEQYYFRIKATNDNGESGWTDIVSTAIGTTPEVPTTWSSTTTVMIGKTLNLYWVHNSEDGSDQKKAILKLTINGEDTLIYFDDDTSVYELNGSDYADSTVIYWSVCTAGVTEEYSDYSMVRMVTVYSPATLGIAVAETLNSFPLPITLTAGPSSQKVVGYYISIAAVTSYETVDNVGNTVKVSAGEEVYSINVNTDETPYTLELTASSNIKLEDDQQYMVTATVAMNSGLTAEVSAYFDVSWESALPGTYEPDASIAINSEILAANIAPYCRYIDEDDNMSLAEGVTLSVYRREADGSFTAIGTNIENTGGATVTDPHPSLDYARYRIVAIETSTGAVFFEDLPGIPILEPSIVIQWDETWSSFDYDGEDAMEEPSWSGSMLKLPGNVDVSESHDADIALIEYIGREHPVSYYGTQLGESGSWSTDIAKDDKETIYGLRRLARYMGDVYVREPSGIGYWASISVSMNLNHGETTVPVSFDIKRVEGGM